MNEYEKHRRKKQIMNELQIKKMQDELSNSNSSLEENVSNANTMRKGLGEIGQSMSTSSNAKLANAGSKLYKFTGQQGLDALKNKTYNGVGKGVNALKSKVTSFKGNPNSAIGQSVNSFIKGTDTATDGLGSIGQSADKMIQGTNTATDGLSSIGQTADKTIQGANTTANTASNASKVAGGASKALGAVGAGMNVYDSATKFAKGDAVGGGLSALKLASLAGGPIGWGIYALATIAEMFKGAQDKKRQKALSQTQEANAEAMMKQKEHQAEVMQDNAERKAEVLNDIGTTNIDSDMSSNLDNMDEYKIDTIEPISQQTLEDEATNDQSEEDNSSAIKGAILDSVKDEFLGEMIDSPTMTESLGKQVGLDLSDVNSPGTIARDMAKTDKSITDDAKGMFAKGNIDIYNRPIVKNSDGTISTVRTMGFQPSEGEFAGKQVLIPTVSDDGRIMTFNEAVDNYYKTGKHLGVFNDIESANKYSESLHNQQDDYYNGNRSERGSKMTGGASPIDNIDLIADQEKYMRDNNFTTEHIKGLRQGLNYGNKETADWIDQYNKGAGSKNPIRIPQTEKEIELAKKGQFNPVPQEASVDEKKTLKDLIMQNIGDSLGGFAEGYRENRNNGFNPDNLVDRKMADGSDKTILNRAGEALGTANRLLTNPLLQGGLAGLAYGIDKGDALYGLGKGVEWAGNKAKSNMYAKELGQQPTVLGNITADDYKAVTTSAYRQLKLIQDSYIKEKKRYDDLLKNGQITPQEYKENIYELNGKLSGAVSLITPSDVQESNQTRIANVAEGNLEERIKHDRITEGLTNKKIQQSLIIKQQKEEQEREKAVNLIKYMNMSDIDKEIALPQMIKKYGEGIVKTIDSLQNVYKKTPAGL